MQAPPAAGSGSPAAGRRDRRWLGLAPVELALLLAAAAFVLLASYRGWWPIAVTEAWGFVTGGACVWLIVREQPSNWPLGLANNVFFFLLFWRGRLYADMGLQVVYFGLGVYGWHNWLRGGEHGKALRVSRTSAHEWLLLAAAVPGFTLALRALLVAVNGAAPFWDALTTALSLAAQLLLTRKRLENWLFWIAADVIYVPLYLSRDLPLTAVLYGVFLLMCFFGLRSWWRSWCAQHQRQPFFLCHPEAPRSGRATRDPQSASGRIPRAAAGSTPSE